MRCPYDRCAGDGWLIDERTRSASECRCMPEQKAARVAGSLRARIPREYQDASFQHTNVSGLPREAVGQVRRYVDTLDERLQAGDGLWISGSIGSGKTWLAMLVARQAIERGQAVAVYSVPRLLSEIRRTYDGEGTKTLDLLDQLTEVTLLVLDDVGTERTNPWVLEQLYSIINERWQERRAIVLTTNLDPIQMQDQIGERAVSRLIGMCETVNVHGVDHRSGRHHIDPGLTGLEAPRPGDPGHDPSAARSGGPLGPPPPLDPDTAAWAVGAGPSPGGPPRYEDADRPGQGPDGGPARYDESGRPDAGPGRYDDAGRPGSQSDRYDGGRPATSSDGFGAPPPPRTFGADPAEARRPQRGRYDGRDQRRD
ncbi:ATP-binding protein [Patulibacter sp. NPDC049589]|uniref:ATP-binding protein n=1 Tax=Patulibacter sp. NPDC049589 TaxID=3154731 RepID=UPI00342D0B04